MEGVAPSRKREYLDALGEQFPRWQPVARRTDTKVDESPVEISELVELLVSRLGELSEEQRNELAGMFGPSGGAGGDEADAGAHHLEIWKRLGIDAGAAPSRERTWRLLGGLLDFFLSLDQLGWTLWRNMGVKSAFWKESDLAKLAGAYLVGDHEVSTEQTRLTIERTRRLIAAIVGAPGRAAMDVANQHDQQFSPENIEQAARTEKRALESLDAACWREYKQRYSSGGTPAHLEAAIQRAVAQAAEDLIGGRVR